MHARKIILPAALILIAHCCLGQFTDDCSDGELTTNPVWSGDHAKFNVTAGRMRLLAPAITDEAFLSTPSQAIYNATWEFFLQMDFTPSSSNFVKIYLVSDEQILGGSLNGYFIKAGNTSKEISLYRQIGTSELEIIDGLDDRLNLAAVKVKIKVTRDDVGQWQLNSDVGLTGVYSQEGTVVDNTHTSSLFFGVECIYTSTRSDKFWFDDFVVSGIPVPDMKPPFIQTITVMDEHQVSLRFSEEVDHVSAGTASNYQLVSSGAPNEVSLQSDQRTVWLNFNTGLSNGVTYSIRVSGVKDLAGNMMTAANIDALFFKAVPVKPKDIIFTEIFPDPSPQIGLPAAEFIEIYNRSADAFDLKGWRLSDGGSVAVFPAQIILPGEYWIITSSSSTALYSHLGKTLGLVNFPTLNNAGEHLSLKDSNLGIIDSVSYSLAEYRDVDKQEGGWTLELIDPNQPCGEQENWTSSEDAMGGTPGRQNSVLANKPDLTGPLLISVFPETSTRVMLYFNEKLDPASLSTSHFSMEERKMIYQASFRAHSNRTIVIELQDTLSTGHSYFLEGGGIKDCSGNDGTDFHIGFGLPEKADSNDLIINEILFDPRPGGSDFVEVYNRSEKYLNMKNWKLGNVEDGVPTNISTLFTDNMLLAPDEFAVFTPDPQMVKLHYPQAKMERLRSAELPGLPDDQGSVGVMDEQGQLVDALSYSRQWHSPFLKEDEGVSLERISVDAGTNHSDNWTSASSRAGFATPGFGNSQHPDSSATRAGEVIVAPEIFSPAGGGPDFVEIRYNLEQPGWVANVKIVDQQGHQLKTVAINETIGPQGFFRWDGDRENGNRARSGYYLVWFELYNAEGAVRTFRKRVVVADR